MSDHQDIIFDFVITCSLKTTTVVKKENEIIANHYRHVALFASRAIYCRRILMWHYREDTQVMEGVLRKSITCLRGIVIKLRSDVFHTMIQQGTVMKACSTPKTSEVGVDGQHACGRKNRHSFDEYATSNPR